MNLVTRLLRPLGSTTSASSLVIDGTRLPVTLRRNPNARRFILRLDRSGDGVTVTVPVHASDRAAMEFAASQANWIEQQRRKRAEICSFADGVVLPVRGREHVISHMAKARGTVWQDDGEPLRLCVAGRPEHLARRVKDWLKAQARSDLETASQAYSAAMGLRFSRISIRDQSSRWGSCSNNGTLSYSWRLVLAPPFVLDYVAAHEVAHLKEMNHGERFWNLVETHCPHTAGARRWLRKNGSGLHRYGA